MARILIIDDEANIRLMMRLALQARGHGVETAADGAQGLELFGDGSEWDLVLLDQRMPGLEGLDVLRHMRSLDPHAKVVMVTAFGTVDLAASAMGSGATDFLRKPFTMEVLRGTVQTALDGVPPDAATDAHAALGSVISPVRSFGVTSINGYRIESGKAPEADGQTKQTRGDDNIRYGFMVRDPAGDAKPCTVVFPSYFVELVKAHIDCENIPDAPHFWLWLSEEALANYLWQNAEIPPDGVLHVEELTTNLRRWIDAVVAV